MYIFIEITLYFESGFYFIQHYVRIPHANKYSWKTLSFLWLCDKMPHGGTNTDRSSPLSFGVWVEDPCPRACLCFPRS